MHLLLSCWLSPATLYPLHREVHCAHCEKSAKPAEIAVASNWDEANGASKAATAVAAGGDPCKLATLRQFVCGKCRMAHSGGNGDEVDSDEEDASCDVCCKSTAFGRNLLLLCDGAGGGEECSVARHLWCCTPALSKVPAGSWRCRPVEGM